MDHRWSLAMITAIKIGSGGERMHLRRGPFWWPWQCAGVTWRASPDAAWPGLHQKPLDAAIGRLLTPYRPGGRQGDNQLNDYETCTHFVGRFDGYRDAAVLYPADRPMEKVRGFRKKPLNATIGQALAPISYKGHANSGCFGHFIVKKSSIWHVGH